MTSSRAAERAEAGRAQVAQALASSRVTLTQPVLDTLEQPEVWPALYVRWELGLLSALGFGLDLEECAITGANDGLTHVSPKTGRAVRGSEAEPYLNRLLALPDFLMRPAAPVMPGARGPSSSSGPNSHNTPSLMTSTRAKVASSWNSSGAR